MNYEYDKNGKMTKAVDGFGNTWVWDYDSNQNLIHHKGPGTEWIKEYDTLNREVKYVCGSRVVETTYDVNGNQSQTERTI